MLKKMGRITGGVMLVLLVGSAVLYLVFDEELPQGEQSPVADSLAKKMLEAVKHESYKSTRFLEWTFSGHHYVWDKQRHVVDVSWEDHQVNLHTKAPYESNVWVNGEIIKDSVSHAEIVNQATKYFNNDSFWLVAPHKVFDPGTERRLVTLDSGKQALLVTYTSGGTTPGDSYLWLLEDSGLPGAWKMWVDILPIGGLKTTWESWELTESGTLLPTRHQLLFLEFKIEDVKGRQ